MANSIQDFGQFLVQLKPTFPPQLLSATGNGAAIDVTKVGANRITAGLILGNAVALTSLDVKLQAAYDDGAGNPTGWVDISGAAFPQVTVNPGTGGNVPVQITFQLPLPLTQATAPYQYVRAVATLVGTSIQICVKFLACRRYDEANLFVAAPGNAGNGVIN